jgi:hypothetical protein
MVTTKKKTSTDDKITKQTKASNKTWPKIVQGTHLTVKTFEDGRTELAWDDEALLREVQIAILKAESRIPVDIKPNVKAKAVKKITESTKHKEVKSKVTTKKSKS